MRVASSMRRGETGEGQALRRVVETLATGAGDFDESEVWLFSAETLALVSALVEARMEGRYSDEAPHLRRLIDILPSDAGMLRLGVQAGAWGGDKALAEKSLKLLEKHHPRLAPLARDFIENNPTPPGRR